MTRLALFAAAIGLAAVSTGCAVRAYPRAGYYGPGYHGAYYGPRHHHGYYGPRVYYGPAYAPAAHVQVVAPVAPAYAPPAYGPGTAYGPPPAATAPPAAVAAPPAAVVPAQPVPIEM